MNNWVTAAKRQRERCRKGLYTSLSHKVGNSPTLSCYKMTHGLLLLNYTSSLSPFLSLTRWFDNQVPSRTLA